mmetsp:Transcript_4139/g.7003  ORF Transcript_4139/g.7003 Transcript_4139/m.7003 type:complete len:96 (-) Transcript_4139:256-543(-)
MMREGGIFIVVTLGYYLANKYNKFLDEIEMEQAMERKKQRKQQDLIQNQKDNQNLSSVHEGEEGESSEEDDDGEDEQIDGGEKEGSNPGETHKDD